MTRLLPLLLLLAACDVSPTVVVANYGPIEPSAAWAARYQELASCAGVRAMPFPLIRWYRSDVLHYREFHNEWETAGGVWLRPLDVIIRADKVDNVGTAAHEMMHVILQTGEHTPAFLACGVP